MSCFTYAWQLTGACSSALMSAYVPGWHAMEGTGNTALPKVQIDKKQGVMQEE